MGVLSVRNCKLGVVKCDALSWYFFRHSVRLHYSLGLSEKLQKSRKEISVSERKYVTSLHVMHQNML